MPLPLAIPLVMAGAGLATKGYGMYEANKREKEANRQLAELAKKPYERYKVNPLVQKYTQMGLREIQNPQGFTGAEAAQFQQRVAAAQEAARRNALSLGGSSVSRAVQGSLGSANLAAQNQFAAQNAALARTSRNLGFNRFMQGAGVAQGIDQMNTQTELNRRMMLEQALGAASRQAADQKRSMISGMGSDLLGAGLSLGMQGGFGSNQGNSFFGSNALNEGMSQQAQMNAAAKGFSNIPKIAPDRGTRTSAIARRALRNMPAIPYDESYFDVSGLGQ